MPLKPVKGLCRVILWIVVVTLAELEDKGQLRNRYTVGALLPGEEHRKS